MRITGYLIVASTFVGVALVAYAVIQVLHWDKMFALVAAAIVATLAGDQLWDRQAPLLHVKLGLGLCLFVTAVVFTLVFRAITGWPDHPEIVIPIAAIVSFVFPSTMIASR